jgi:hypothetical protein
VDELFEFAVKYTGLYLWLSRIDEAIKEGRQKDDMCAVREQDFIEIVQHGTLNSEDQSQGVDIRG